MRRAQTALVCVVRSRVSHRALCLFWQIFAAIFTAALLPKNVLDLIIGISNVYNYIVLADLLRRLPLTTSHCKKIRKIKITFNFLTF
jgi:hypothetical protein